MGKRYHCEYCNRSFADTLHTRKNHINGVQHKRNRKLHYDSFKGRKKRYVTCLLPIHVDCFLLIMNFVHLHVDPAVLLAEETSKPPCRKFFATGELVIIMSVELRSQWKGRNWSVLASFEARTKQEGWTRVNKRNRISGPLLRFNPLTP